MTWTQFYDMHSGGGLKELPYAHIYIEADYDEAVSVFYAKFGHNPSRVTCTCCGEDYSITTNESLNQITGFERGLISAGPKRFHPDHGHIAGEGDGKYTKWNQASRYLEPTEPMPDGWIASGTGWGNEKIELDEYLTKKDVLIIRVDEIADDERRTNVPEEGFVWVGD